MPFFEQQAFRSQHHNEDGEPSNSFNLTVTFHWQYIASYLEKELKSFFRRQLSGKLSLNVVHDGYKIGDMFKHKELQPKLYRHNVAN